MWMVRWAERKENEKSRGLSTRLSGRNKWEQDIYNWASGHLRVCVSICVYGSPVSFLPASEARKGRRLKGTIQCWWARRSAVLPMCLDMIIRIWSVLWAPIDLLWNLICQNLSFGFSTYPSTGILLRVVWFSGQTLDLDLGLGSLIHCMF